MRPPPFETVQHGPADGFHPAPSSCLVETVGKELVIDETIGGDVVKICKQMLTDH